MKLNQFTVIIVIVITLFVCFLQMQNDYLFYDPFRPPIRQKILSHSAEKDVFLIFDIINSYFFRHVIFFWKFEWPLT